MWYYAQGQEQVGPLDEAAFRQALQAGQIGPDTLVWRDGMGDWQPWRTVQDQMRNAQPGAMPQQPGAGGYAQQGYGAPGGGAMSQCVECGNMFPMNDMVSHQGRTICANCKPRYFQRLQEGGAVPGIFQYAGFWVRFCAKFLDGIITGVINMVFGFIAGAVMVTSQPTPESIMAMQLVLNLIGFAVFIGYNTFFLGRFGATPGKMALGLKVVRPDGTPLTYGRACGRTFAEILSSFTLLIGYIMAAFDEQKRALHDRIADTRVIKA